MIHKLHPFVVEYDRRCAESGILSSTASFFDHKQIIKLWYGYDVEADAGGFSGTLYLTEEQYTLFLLKYGAT